ncbi:MAG: hypothetical protein U5L45_13565 [Saprospiraceae bacterium]|nr:hypothetical protein [Saprospiraceae bacterium]
MVHFSGFARKMNHIPLFPRERSERELSNYDKKTHKNLENLQKHCIFVE